MDTNYKKIPGFKNYIINQQGEVVNYTSLQKIKPVNGKINMCHDNGKRTTRRLHLLIKEIFKNDF